jgi:hypothetical protein
MLRRQHGGLMMIAEEIELKMVMGRISTTGPSWTKALPE